MRHAPGRHAGLPGAILLCLLAGCVTHPGTVPETLSGQVVDADTGDPIRGARLHLADVPGKVAISSEDGQFTLETTRQWPTVFMGKDLNSGRVLVVDAASYDPLKADVKLGEATDLLLRMHRAARKPGQ